MIKSKADPNHLYTRRMAWFAAALLTVAAVVKGWYLFTTFPGDATPDRIIWFLPSNVLTSLIIGLELWTAQQVMFSKCSLNTTLHILLILSCCFIGYRVALWYYFGLSATCGCFGPIDATSWYSSLAEIGGTLGIAVVMIWSFLALIFEAPNREN